MPIIVLLHLSLLSFLTSNVVAQTCALCPEGSTMGAPEKPIFDVTEFTSCGGIDTLLGPIPTAGCATALASLDNGPVDFREYCECSDFVGPDVCSLCEEGVELANPDVPQDMIGGYTCSQLSDLAEASFNADSCLLFTEASPFCCASADGVTNSTGVNLTCQLCEGDAEILDPLREIFLLGDITCTDFNTALMYYAQYPMCDIFPFFDTPAFCRCEGTVPRNTCEMCNVTSPQKEVYIAAINETITCAGLAELAIHAIDETLCDIFPPLESECCLPTPEPTGAPTTVPIPTSAPTGLKVPTREPFPEAPTESSAGLLSTASIAWLVKLFVFGGVIVML